jgi:hypothetical protein
MRRHLCYLLTCVMLSVCWAPADAAPMDDGWLDAVCRVRAGSGVGSGCVIRILDGQVYVLTAAHVVESPGAAVQCDMFHSGHCSAPIPGRVVALDQACDVAICVLPASGFGGLLPEQIPLAGPEDRVQPGEAVITLGCAEGRWASAYRGHATGYSEDGQILMFIPPPASGRSGSPLLLGDGSAVVGVVSFRANSQSESAYGGAMSTAAIWRAFGASQTAGSCGPGGCPPDGNSGNLFRRPMPRPFQRPAPQPYGEGGGAWPTLPPGVITPPTPPPPAPIQPAEPPPPETVIVERPAELSPWWIGLGPGVAVATMLVALVVFAVCYAAHLGAQTRTPARKK